MGKAQQKGKASKKIKQDTFLKKEWRHVFVPGFFSKRDIGFTVSHKCARGKTPADYLNNRVFELSHGDLVDEQSHAYRLFSWKSVDVQNNDVLTVFAGMRLTNDKLSSLLRKYRTLINAQVDVPCYAQQSKKREIRDACIAIMKETIEKSTIPELCQTIVNETIEKEKKKKCKTIMQVDNVYVTKIKVIKAPTFSGEELKKLHQGRAVTKAAEVARPVEEEPKTEETK
ncbi:40S ribosomal protein S3a [Histomonas meleagridis]|uniref:40S ribosomal protein S3a n=1 Tax=Histomonas meleagridis TaxID=135588 RepID=UPI003559BFB3|nr:40S ribosomal protein S3a [Histomonas meleagridis]